MREWGQDLLHHLGHWLSVGNEHDLALRYERLGKLCFEQQTLHETVRGLSLLREKMLDFAEEHMVSSSSVEWYAEEELERRLGHSFDLLTIHLARGFEEAIRKSADSRLVTR